MEDGPKAKRLRGHDLELQKRKACTLTKGQSKRKSGLCEKLLSLWANGQLSAKMCQELAHLAVLDGAQGQELAHMASCGNWGQVGGNCHRDFMANWCKGNPLSPPYEVEVPVRDPKTSKVGKDIFCFPISTHLTHSSLKRCLEKQVMWHNFGRMSKQSRMKGCQATLFALTKGRALSKGMWSMQNTQSHCLHMLME